MATTQLLYRDLGGRTRVARFGAAPLVAPSTLFDAVGAATGLPPGCFRLVTGSREVCVGGAGLEADPSTGLLPTLTVLLRLRGGKARPRHGGFGSLLRAGGKGGRLTATNDACRDLTGRRLRNVNAEAKLAAWAAGAKQRELEAVAEAHVARVAREAKGGADPGHAAGEALAQEADAVSRQLAASVAAALALKRKGEARGSGGGDEGALRTKKLSRPPGWADDSDDSDDDESSDDDDGGAAAAPAEHATATATASTALAAAAPAAPAAPPAAAAVDAAPPPPVEAAVAAAAAAEVSAPFPPLPPVATAPPPPSSSLPVEPVSRAPPSRAESPPPPDCTILRSAPVPFPTPSRLRKPAPSPPAAATPPPPPPTTTTVESGGAVESVRATVLPATTPPAAPVEPSAPAPSAAGAAPAAAPPAAAAGAPPPAAAAAVPALDPINLALFDSPKALEACGMERLKAALSAAGMKCGGKLEERAARLWLLKGGKGAVPSSAWAPKAK